MSEQVTLIMCPPGLFLFEGSICLKTEYGTEAPEGSGQWWPEAYCGDSGEFFWGGTKTHEERAKLMVIPIDQPNLARNEALEEAAALIDAAAKVASKEGDIKRNREYEFRAALIRELKSSI